MSLVCRQSASDSYRSLASSPPAADELTDRSWTTVPSAFRLPPFEQAASTTSPATRFRSPHNVARLSAFIRFFRRFRHEHPSSQQTSRKKETES